MSAALVSEQVLPLLRTAPTFPQPVWEGVWLLPDLFSGERKKLQTPLGRLQSSADQGLEQLTNQRSQEVNPAQSGEQKHEDEDI